QHATIELLANGLRGADSSRNGTMVGQDLLIWQAGEAPYGTPIRVGDALIWIARGGFDPRTGRDASPSGSSEVEISEVQELIPDEESGERKVYLPSNVAA